MDSFKLPFLDHLFEPIIIVTENKRTVYFNHYFSAFSRYSPRMVKREENFTNFFFNSSIDIVKFFNNAFKKDNSSVTEEIQISFKDLSATYEVVIKVVPLLLENKKHFLICFHDLSIEKKLYDKYRTQLEELRKGHAQIVQADKLTSIGELTASITSDINNPLTTATGNCELMGSYFTEGDLNKNKKPLIKCNDELKNSLGRINEIILNMKNFLGTDEDKKEYCHLKDVITDAIGLVSPAFKEVGYEIERDFKDENIASFIDRIKIEQILVNLLENSFYAMQEAKQKNGVVAIKLYQQDEYVIIDIKDNGPGIPSESKDKIFNTFFSTKKSAGGSGLGLAISSKIIDAHQGTLNLEQMDAPGALFRIRLPILELGSVLLHQYTSHPLNFEETKEGIKIMVLEHDVKSLNTLTEFLELDGHTAIGSVNGMNALKILKSIEVDLIITCFDMPKMNGSVFAKKVREMGINCPILYLIDKKHEKKFIEDKDKYQVSGFIPRPFKQKEVLRVINSILKN